MVEADRTRKHMLGLRPQDHVHVGAWQGAYDPAFTEDVYGEVLRRAEVVLASGRSVVVDASFRSREMRSAARGLARRLRVPFRFVECAAPPAVCRARLATRPDGASDATAAIFDDFCARFEPAHDLSAEERLVVDTGGPPGVALAAVRGWVPVAGAGGS